MQKFRDRMLLLGGVGALLYGMYRLFKRQTETLDAVKKLESDLDERLEWEFINNTRQVQSLIWLHQQIQFDVPLAPTRSWAISPDFATLLVEILRQYQPTTILELGGGTSTVVTAKIMQQINPKSRIFAVEDKAQFVETTRINLRKHAVDDIATVIHAPLKDVDVNGTTWQWYDPDCLTQIQNVDLLVVDGPPQFANPRRMARYPALPVLCNQLSEQALVLMDDADREDETMIAGRWLSEYPQFNKLRQEINFEKGAVLMGRGY